MMNEKDYAAVISQKILQLRKEKGLTQEALADQLSLTYQAVSKWENGLSTPDVTLFPAIAQVFQVEIGELFGFAPLSTHKTRISGLPWEDDDVIHGVVYQGHRLLEYSEDMSRFTFTYNGPAACVETRMNLFCGLIQGNGSAGGNIKVTNEAGDDIGIGGNAEAGGEITCGEIMGNAEAGSKISCGNVGGNVEAGGSISCGNIEGDAEAGCNINCGNISGRVKAGNTIICQGNQNQ